MSAEIAELYSSNQGKEGIIQKIEEDCSFILAFEGSSVAEMTKKIKVTPKSSAISFERLK